MLGRDVEIVAGTLIKAIALRSALGPLISFAGLWAGTVHFEGFCNRTRRVQLTHAIEEAAH
jgi:hypothetical protein